jgi:hypothetical protein
MQKGKFWCWENFLVWKNLSCEKFAIGKNLWVENVLRKFFGKLFCGEKIWEWREKFEMENFFEGKKLRFGKICGANSFAIFENYSHIFLFLTTKSLLAADFLIV